MAPSSQTLNYDAILSSTLQNYRPTLEDNISLMNALVYFLMKKSSKGYKEVTELGANYIAPLMYAVGGGDSYSKYDQLDVTPLDGITSSVWSWVQASAPIVISGYEEKVNSGSEKLIDLLEAKTEQATIGIKEFFGKALLQGNGVNSATAITTPYTSGSNGSTFIDPLPKLIAYDPTASVNIGNINQNTYSWWRNQYKDFSSLTTYATFLNGLRNLNNTCSKWGQKPNLALCDQLTYEAIERALASYYQNVSYQKADIPFDNFTLKGVPVTWDDLVPDVGNGTQASIPVSNSGALYFLNTDYIQIRVHKGTNFASTGFVRPENQDAKVAQLLWLGTIAVTNRRCQGVAGKIQSAMTS
jgi:hypothetical protein